MLIYWWIYMVFCGLPDRWLAALWRVLGGVAATADTGALKGGAAGHRTIRRRCAAHGGTNAHSCKDIVNVWCCITRIMITIRIGHDQLRLCSDLGHNAAVTGRSTGCGTGRAWGGRMTERKTMTDTTRRWWQFERNPVVPINQTQAAMAATATAGRGSGVRHVASDNWQETWRGAWREANARENKAQRQLKTRKKLSFN